MLDILKGRPIEIFGEADSGKTKFSLSLIDEDDIVLFIDADRKMYKIDKNQNNIFIYECNDIEDISLMLNKIIKYINVVIIDSLPTLKLKSYDINSDKIDKSFFKIIKNIITICKMNNCTILIINQKRFNNNTFGYNMLYNYYSLRIEIINRKPKIISNRLNKKLTIYNLFS